MTKRRVLLIFDIVLGAVILTLVAIMSFFVYVEGRLYSRTAQLMDLQEKELTIQEYERLQEKLPGCTILWSVPFQGEYLLSDETGLAVTTLSDEDVSVLDFLPSLRLVDGRNCDNYPQLAELQLRHPQCEVLYSVPIQGTNYDQDTIDLSLIGLTPEEAALLDCLTKLKQVNVTGCSDYELLSQLEREHPQWTLSYTVLLGAEEYSRNASSLTVHNTSYQQLEAALLHMPQLRSIHLVNPLADGKMLLSLQEQYPGITFTWEVDLYGIRTSWDTREFDISGVQVESCEEVEKAVACLPHLEKLIMSDCGIDNETMAAFRERKRDEYKVVWTVYLSDKTKARTDDIYFMPIQQGEYYFMTEDAYNLRYCEDMICLDLGHHMIRNIDFVEFMPHLKYLILAHSGVRDISPIVHCQELVYLEVDWSEIQDYTPIAQLKSLEDLNINKTYCDITPLLEMTWLKNLWAPGRSHSTRVLLEEALPNTRLVFSNTPEGQGWRNLPNYYAMRDVLGMPYMK